MKFVIKQNILLENLLNTSKAVASKNTMPILTGILFELKDDGLYLSAKDDDMAIRTFIKKEDITKIVEKGSIVVSGRYIVERIKKIPEGDISIEVIDGYNMIIQTDFQIDGTSNDSESKLNGSDPEEFPNLNLEETKAPIVFNPSVLKNIVNQTFFCTSISETLPLLTGINFKLEKNILEVVATDSYRLAAKTIDLKDKYENGFNIVVPGKNLLELSRMLDDDKENIYMHIFSDKVIFKYKNIVFLSRLISGTYPASIDKVIPESFAIDIECNCDILYNMIDRVSVFTSDKDKNIIKLALENKELIISSNSPEIGAGNEKTSIDNDGKISISFSSKYMLEAIKSFNSEKIHLLMNDDNSKIILKSDEDKTLIQLVLPIKTY